MKRLVGLVLLAVVARSSVDSTSSGDDFDDTYVTHLEYLKRKLVTDREYDPTTRPRNNSSEPTVVHIPVHFENIYRIVLADGWFSVAIWLCMNWKDDRLEGSKEDFQGVPHVSLDLSEVWWPRVDVVTARQEDCHFLPRLAVVTPEADVWMCYTTKVRSPCSVDAREFPNDEQVCSIRLMSSAYSESEVKLLGGQVWGSHKANASTEWNVTDISFRNHTDLDRSFVDVNFHLRRLGSRHRFTVTVPAVASALVMLAAFWMPPDSERRLTVACLNFLFLALMLYRIAEVMGDSVTVPKIISFLALAAVVEMLTVAESALDISISRSNARVRVPDAIHRRLTGSCGTVLCLSRSDWRKVSSNTGDSEETPTFDECLERKQRWLTLAQAVDRILFLAFGFMAMGFLL
ncbi:acetylcholine receptor subunit beta-type unc-29-like [Amblyomma americanum]